MALSLRPKPFPPTLPPGELKIIPTPKEERVFAILDGCVRHIHEKEGLKTSCRVAGGWVRDKLLGLESNDIDIALEDMMGAAFGERLVAYLQEHPPDDTEAGEELKTNLKVATMKGNPEQSKHLETARTMVLGIELDLVNLRSEAYAEGSRIPTEVKFGTPLEDTLRRDTTVNALFYNIHTKEVEDLTQKGLDDLRAGLIRTPLAPLETFRDDPLRVLRCIRFASRFGFSIVSEVQDAARDKSIQEALARKISRERVGIELDKMMTGRDPVEAIQLIYDLSLYLSIFHLPDSITTTLSAPPGPATSAISAARILRTFFHPSPSASEALPALHPTLSAALSSIPAVAPRMYLACALTPFRNITYADRKRKPHWAAEGVLREAVRLGSNNHYLDGIPPLFEAAEILKNPVITKERWGKKMRVEIGSTLRERSVHNPRTGTFWTTSVTFALVQELIPVYDPIQDALDVEKAREIIQTYNIFVNKVEELDLPSMVEARPFLTGVEVTNLLGARKAGLWTASALQKLMEWQLEFPSATKEEAEEWLKGEIAAGRITPEDVPEGPKRFGLHTVSKRTAPSDELQSSRERKKLKQGG